MCEKCCLEEWRRHTRYCDDWWDDSSHGGYKGDRELKREIAERNERYERELHESNWGRWWGDE